MKSLFLFLFVLFSQDGLSSEIRVGLLGGAEYRNQEHRDVKRGASLRAVGTWTSGILGTFAHLEARGTNEFEYTLGGLLHFGDPLFFEPAVSVSYIDFNGLSLGYSVTLGYEFSGTKLFTALFASFRPNSRAHFLFGPLFGMRL
jgi:hypothetical protein